MQSLTDNRSSVQLAPPLNDLEENAKGEEDEDEEENEADDEYTDQNSEQTQTPKATAHIE